MLDAVWPLILTNASILIAIMVVLWLVSLIIDDVSFVDAFWPVGFIVVAWLSHVLGEGAGWRSQLMAILVTIWGLRLAVHLLLRWRKVGKDPRYESFISRQRMNRALFTLLFVFLLQGLLIVGISLPMQFVVIHPGAEPLQALGMAGIGLWIFGFFFEAIGDWQLTQFKRNPENAGKVLDHGLWRYTRHPNYFGEICMFWGLYLIGAETGIGPWAFPGPLLLTVILISWSGVRLVEKRLKSSRPDYDDYMARTSALIPWFPKKS